MQCLFSEPRRCLRIVGWEVGDRPDEQIAAAFLLSSLVAVLLAAVYLLGTRAYCGPQSVSAQSARQRKKNAKDACSSMEADSLWTVHNKRYDLRDFVPKHPGGVDAISLGQGYNCTELFESYHSLANQKFVRAALARYYVEDTPPGAADYDQRFEWVATPFYDTLKARVRSHFQRRSGGHRANFRQWVQLLFFVAASGLALLAYMCGQRAAMVLLPLFYWWGPSPCMHDGGHFSLSRQPWVNRLCAHLGAAHMSLFSWYHQHTIGHHVDTNLAGYDPDLYHFSLGSQYGIPGFRTSVEIPPCSTDGMQRHWRLGLWRILFSTVGPVLPWDVTSLALPVFEQAFLGLVPYRKYWMEGLYMHALGQTILCWLAFIHPVTVCIVGAQGWISAIASAYVYVSVPYALHGALFYVFSQVSHIQQECFAANLSRNDESNEALQPTQVGLPTEAIDSGETASLMDTGHPLEAAGRREWAIHQVETTLDYAVNSYFWLHVSNGLNLQVVHHLFPQVGWGHYKELSPIIEEVCKEFNVKYSTKPNFFAALRSHYRYLVSINDEPTASIWRKPTGGRASPDALQILGQLPSANHLPGSLGLFNL